MTTRLLLLFAINVLTASPDWAASCGKKLITEQQLGQVQVSAFDDEGRPLRPKELSLQGPDLPNGWRWPRPVPYGEYVLQVEVDGYRSLATRIRVDQPEVLVRVAPLRAPGLYHCGDEPRYGNVHGTVSGIPNGHELWIKAVPLRGLGGAETRVGRYGNFLIGGLDHGSYVLLVMDGSTVLSTKTAATGDRVIAIDLNSR